MSGSIDWREEPVGRHHDRKRFDCGSPELNEYLERFARQNHESGGAKTFVAVPPAEPARVLGYYSIGPGALEFARVPARLTRKLGRYEVPVFRLGRLAVSLPVQGRRLGAITDVVAASRKPRGRGRTPRPGIYSDPNVRMGKLGLAVKEAGMKIRLASQ